MNRIRDYLTPWLIVAVSIVAFLPLILSAGCEIACELGTMPMGACGHTTMGASAGHFTGEMVASAPLVQSALAALALLVLFAFSASGERRVLAPIRVEMPAETRAGTRLRI